MQIIHYTFSFIVGLGGSALMFIVIFLLSLGFKVKFSKAFEGALRMAIALSAMSALVSLLTSNFSPALAKFVKNTGIGLSISDLGWSPLAVITWGSLYTIFFIFLTVLVNLVMLGIKKTNTLNVDLFNLWNVSLLGLIMKYYSHSLIAASIFVIFIYVLILKNADAIKPTVSSILGYTDDNVSTSSHPLLLVAPFVLILDCFIDRFLPFIDRYDFNAEQLNKKIGFWGSNFAIGAYLGVFIGILGQQTIAKIFTLAFMGGTCLELFAVVGGWFGPAVEPLSQGVETAMSNKLRGRKLYVGLDWAIMAGRPEVWAVTDVLAPILLAIAIFLPGNKVMPLGGILITTLTPALLVVTRGKVLRMTIIGTILIPLFLWTATLVAKCLTALSLAEGNLPTGIQKGHLFSSIDALPVEKLLSYVIGNTVSDFTIVGLIVSVAFVSIYLLIFKWYYKKMKNREIE